MAVTFTRTTATHDPTTGTYTTSGITIPGNAIQVRGNPERYRAAGLVLSTMPTLLWSPTTYGSYVPEPGDTVTWPETGGSAYTVRDVDPIAPDGVLIAARVVIGK